MKGVEGNVDGESVGREHTHSNSSHLSVSLAMTHSVVFLEGRHPLSWHDFSFLGKEGLKSFTDSFRVCLTAYLSLY